MGVRNPANSYATCAYSWIKPVALEYSARPAAWVFSLALSEHRVMGARVIYVNHPQRFPT
jgi:hypothetical protein